MGKYNVFVRNWWKLNKDWPDGLEPGPGRKTYIRHGVSIDEARKICEDYNDTHERGKLSRKAEFESA